MISYKSYKDGKMTLTDVVEKLKETIAIEKFFMLSEQEVAYLALKQFNFKKLENNEGSIALYAQKLLDLTGFLKKSDQPITHFVRVFLNLGKNLLRDKNRLEEEAKEHLRQVEDLLAHYYSIPYIQKYRAEAQTPRNNEERKYQEFYKRSLEKKDEIISYLLNGILYRAFDKSSPGLELDWGPNMEDIKEEIERSKDFPYMDMQYGSVLKYELSMERLDYRKINPLINKIQWMEKGKQLTGHYTKEINLGFERRIEPKSFFEELLSKLNDLPLIRERYDMFVEMEFLFSQEKWYALYALALPQVEGIFSEMIMMNPAKKRSASLTDKVNHVRDFYQLAHYTFDYYQFTLADLRNHFSHTGKISDPKTKCIHLLLDIRYLLSIGPELDTLMSRSSKIIREGAEKLKHIGDINQFFSLIQLIDKDGKLTMIKSMADQFVYQQILKKIKLIRLLKLLREDFKDSLTKFNKNLGNLMKVYGGGEYDFLSAGNKETRDKLDSIRTAFEKIPLLLTEDFKLLLDCCLLLSLDFS